MDTMETAVLILHTFVAIMLVVMVLLQRGKGADAGAAFGSGASGTVFGARGSANFFSRATAVLATAFFVTSLALAYMTSQDSGAPQSLLESAPAVTPEPDMDNMPMDPPESSPGSEMPALPRDDASPQDDATPQNGTDSPPESANLPVPATGKPDGDDSQP